MARNKEKILKIAIQLNKEYGEDFVGWVNKYINFDGLPLNGLTEQQIEVSEALLKHHYVAVAGGGGIGKTALASLLIIWFLSTHPFSKIPTTAPSRHLLQDVLWSEIGLWLDRCSLRHLFHKTTTRLQVKGIDSWFAVARTVPREPGKVLNDTLAGFHAPHLLIVGDEASGIPDPVFSALDGALTNKSAYILLISNPVSVSGYFYDVISGESNAGYVAKNYSSLESPLVDENYEKRIVDRYGYNSPMYKAKVLGSLIEMNDGVIITPQVYDEVVENNKMIQDGSIVLGVDVGGAEDNSVICHRVGNSIVHWDIFSKHDNDALVGEVLKAWEFRYQKKHITVVVDAIGKGAGVYSNLKNMNKFDVIGSIGSEKAVNDMTYANKRTELYDRLKRDFPYLHFPEKPPKELKKELCSIRYDFSKEKVTLEDKRSLIKSLGHSPDRSDALSLTEAAEIYVTGSKGYVNNKVITMPFIRRRGEKYGKFSRFV